MKWTQEYVETRFLNFHSKYLPETLKIQYTNRYEFKKKYLQSKCSETAHLHFVVQ
jgi:hypothetical protein